MSAPFSRLKRFFRDLANNETRRLKHFSLSAICFFVGYGMIYWINRDMPPSTRQELLALAMIALCAVSFLYAMVLQIVYITSRIFR